jgi:hypothetical protein
MVRFRSIAVGLVLAAGLISACTPSTSGPGVSPGPTTSTSTTSTSTTTTTLAVPVPATGPSLSAGRIARTPTGNGYWVVDTNGAVRAFGAAHPSWGTAPVGSAVAVAIASTPTGNGYWVFASDGGVFTYGDANFYGSMGGQHLNQPIVGAAVTPAGNGYWLVAADGGIFTFGAVGFYGGLGGQIINKPVVGMSTTPSGNGYWLVAADGGIFTFGDAGFYGGLGGQIINKPVVGMTATPSGHGYWLTAADGGVFTFGDAGFDGSMGSLALNQPVNSITATPTGNGYWLTANDGGVFTFGDANFYGSSPSVPPVSNRQALAQAILASPRILKGSHASRPGVVMEDLQQAAAGQPSNGNSFLSTTLLSVLVQLSTSTTFSISELTGNGTGHAVDSAHYSGRAVDINSINGVWPITGRDAGSVGVIRTTMTMLPGGSAYGQSGCGTTPALPAGISTFADTCNHLHIQVPVGTP